jgi:DNA-binding response OmpR family regulator
MSSAHRGRGKALSGDLTGARIFIVEDEVIIAMELEALMSDAGADVVGPAYSLPPAMRMANNEQISAAILDFRLGRDPVTAVARVLRERSIPFLFYSGQPPGDPIRDEWPDKEIISKPASPERLMRAVGALLEKTSPPKLAVGA